jgi:hypothetical protein
MVTPNTASKKGTSPLHLQLVGASSLPLDKEWRRKQNNLPTSMTQWQVVTELCAAFRKKVPVL